MAEPVIYKVIEEIKLIPENRLSELYDFVHYFRLGLEKENPSHEKNMEYAGCWNDMPEEEFSEFFEDISQRRKQAFSKRLGR